MKTTKKEAPGGSNLDQGVNFKNKEDHPQTTKVVKRLSKREARIADLLRSGKHSIVQLTFKTGYSDPRAYIRTIRDKGIKVQDSWIEKKDIRYKLYWIAPNEPKSVGEIINLDQGLRMIFND